MGATLEFRRDIIYDYGASRNTLKIALLSGVSSGWTSTSSIRFFSDVSIDEAVGTGYTYKAISGYTSTVSVAPDRVEVDWVDVAWTGIGPFSSHSSRVNGIVLFSDSGNNATSRVWNIWDITSSGTTLRTPSGNTFTVRGGATGWLWETVA